MGLLSPSTGMDERWPRAAASANSWLLWFGEPPGDLRPTQLPPPPSSFLLTSACRPRRSVRGIRRSSWSHQYKGKNENDWFISFHFIVIFYWVRLHCGKPQPHFNSALNKYFPNIKTSKINTQERKCATCNTSPKMVQKMLDEEEDAEHGC